MIRGTEGMSDAEIVEEVGKGGRFVCYMFCFSIVVMTFRRASEVMFIKAGASRVTPGLKWTLLTLLVGWWGIPWGPIFSIQCIYTNLTGGKDVTDKVVTLPAPPSTAT